MSLAPTTGAAVPPGGGLVRTTPGTSRRGRMVPVGLAALAAVVYLWNLDVSGWANTYYSAASQAASQSWAAMFFGSIDAAGFITVDKPPVALWVMGLSVRLLGLNPWAILLPQALAGVASVVLLHAIVRRQLGALAAGIAGLAFALTPVAAVIFRYNNPDAVLVLLLLGAAWAVVRGLDDGRIRWVVLAGALVGFAFLTKYLQAFLVLPAFALVWLAAAPGTLRRRIGGLVVAAVSVAVASGWWVVVVDAIPAASRPYIGGSTDNSVLNLVLGYDGLGRLLGGGDGAGGGPGRGPGGAFGGAAGLLRMFNAQWAGEVSWLLPAAAVGLVTGLIATAREQRTSPRRAAFLLWGGWGLVHLLVFSLMGGVAHPYYAVALAPAVAALAGGGLATAWDGRHRAPAAAAVAIGLAVLASAGWGWQVLERTPLFWPGAGIVAATMAVVATLLLVGAALSPDDPRSGAIARGAVVAGVVAMLVGPALYTGATMGRALAGGDPYAGPSDAGATGFGRGPGGAVDQVTAEDALVAHLVENRGSARWLVAVASANQAGPIQLATGVPVMAMGGFMGSDPAPTLDQLRGYIRDGSLRFVLLDGRGAGGPGGPGGFFGGDGQGTVAGERNAWVQQACSPVTAPGVGSGLYDCAGAG